MLFLRFTFFIERFYVKVPASNFYLEAKTKKAVSFFLLKKLGFNMGPYGVRRNHRSHVWQCQIIF